MENRCTYWCVPGLSGTEWKAGSFRQLFLCISVGIIFQGSISITHSSREVDGYLIFKGMVQVGIIPFIILQGSKVPALMTVI